MNLSQVDSEAEMVIKPSFLRWLRSHDLGSTQTLVTLLCLRIRRFTMIISAGGFKQAANSVDKNLKKFTGTLDHWKLLSKCGFLQARRVIAMKSAWIVQYLASDTIWWQEDKYALQKKSKNFSKQKYIGMSKKNWNRQTLTLELIKIMLKCQV